MYNFSIVHVETDISPHQETRSQSNMEAHVGGRSHQCKRVGELGKEVSIFHSPRAYKSSQLFLLFLSHLHVDLIIREATWTTTDA